MIRKLKIERFKSLVKLELELGRINVFVGANGSGKSNLLEGLGVLGAAAFGRVDDETLLRRGVRPGVPRLYRSAFGSKGGKRIVQDIGLEAIDKSGAFLTVTLWNADKNVGGPWTFKTEKLARSNQKTDVVASRSPASGWA